MHVMTEQTRLNERDTFGSTKKRKLQRRKRQSVTAKI